jgi:hypothetical protein
LYRNNRVVTTFEQVFHVMLEAHGKILHARDAKSNKKVINDVVLFFVVLC